MSYQDALARARASAERRLSETVRAGKPVTYTDPETRKVVTGIQNPCYEGPARVKYPTLATTDRDVPGQPTSEQTLHVSIPAGAPLCHEGHEVHVTGSTADGALVGRKYAIAGSPQAGQTSSHRYPLTELT